MASGAKQNHKKTDGGKVKLDGHESERPTKETIQSKKGGG